MIVRQSQQNAIRWYQKIPVTEYEMRDSTSIELFSGHLYYSMSLWLLQASARRHELKALFSSVYLIRSWGFLKARAKYS